MRVAISFQCILSASDFVALVEVFPKVYPKNVNARQGTESNRIINLAQFRVDPSPHIDGGQSCNNTGNSLAALRARSSINRSADQFIEDNVDEGTIEFPDFGPNAFLNRCRDLRARVKGNKGRRWERHKPPFD